MAAGIVRVEAVVAHGLFSLGREVVDDGCDEISGFENFKITLGGVVRFKAIDDGLSGGVPGDFFGAKRDGGGGIRRGACGLRCRRMGRVFQRHRGC